MNIRFILFSFLVLSIFPILSCSKSEPELEPEPEPVVDEEPEALFSLLYPVDTISPYCCISFTWENPFSYPVQLQIASDDQFENLLFDDLINTDSLLFTNRLTPGAHYFWKVILDTIQLSATFQVEPVADAYDGVYEMNAKKWIWSESIPIFLDTVYTTTTTIEFFPNTQKVRVREESSNLNSQLSFVRWSDEGDQLLYHDGGESDGAWLWINLENDSLLVNRNNGGLGGGAQYQFDGKKD